MKNRRNFETFSFFFEFLYKISDSKVLKSSVGPPEDVHMMLCRTPGTLKNAWDFRF